MNNILFVNGCVRGDSRTLMLARKVLSKISGNITELKLNDASLLPLDWDKVQKRRDVYKRQLLSSGGSFR